MTQSPRFRRVFLHIGLGKTGSTSLQLQLLRSARKLESKCAVHYPCRFPHVSDFRGNHSPLLRGLFSADVPAQRLYATLGVRGEQAFEAFNANTLACFERGFAATHADTLLLSAEGIGHFNNKALADLARWLRSLAPQVQLAACIRHPLDALSSEIQQRLTLGAVLEDLYAQPPVYPLRRLFERLEQEFGEDSLLLYDFAAAAADPHGMAGALLRRLGMDPAVAGKPPAVANTSMSHEAALVLSRLNAQRPMLDEAGRSTARAPDDAYRLKRIGGEAYRAPAAVYDAVAARTAEDVAWLRARYGLALAEPEVSASEAGPAYDPRRVDKLVLQFGERARRRYYLTQPLRIPARWLRRQWRRLRTIPSGRGRG